MNSALRYSLLLLAAVLLCTGCPKPLEPHKFLTADPGGGWFKGLLDMAAGGTSPETTTREDQRQVVEPDVIRRDGNLLYVLNQYRGLTIVNLDTQTLLAQVPTYGYPRDLYVVGSRAYVLVGYATQYTTEGNKVSFDIGSKLYALDIADPAHAAIAGSIDLEGDFVDSRLVGDVLYAVSARYQWYWVTGTEDTATGGVSGVGTTTAVQKQQSSDSWVTSVNLSDPANLAVADTLSLSGYGSVIQATSSALFVAAPDWATDSTAITYVDISDPAGAIDARGAATVLGQVADRFKMDAYQGVLRVVSNTNWPNRQVIASTIDLADPDNLKTLGETSLEGAAGETLFATRFDGPRAYIVSYLLKDPLFVVDFADPAHPTLSGMLEVPGWSTHIEPQGDRLIALGVDDTDGRRVCVSLFDVADPAKPALLDRETFGDAWSWSSAYSDVKAFTVMDDMLLVPFSGWTSSGGFERLQFVAYTHDTLDLKGYVDLQGQVLRSFQYNAPYYCVTTEQLAQIDAADPAAPHVTNRLTLAEYVADYLELTPELGVEILTKFDSQTAILRTETLAGAPLGELEVDAANFTAAHAYGTSIVLITTGWDEASSKSYYRVLVVDCATPAAPVLAKDLRFDLQPYWGGYWFYDILPMAATDRLDTAAAANLAAKQAARYWMPWFWWPTGDTTFITGNILTLRCSADAYDITFGSKTPNQGLALIDLGTGELLHTAGLGYDYVDSIHALGPKLYLSTKDDAGADLLGRHFSAYYLQALDPAGPTMSPAANVPGSFVQYNPASGVLLLEDRQYTGGLWNVTRTLNSVTWTGTDDATPIDAFPLPDAAGQLKGRSNPAGTAGLVFYDLYDQAFLLSTVRVDAAGGLSIGDKVAVTDSWAYLIDADATSAYVVVGGGALARYDFSGSPVLVELEPVMNTPQRIRFGAATAYAPLGYAGLLRLSL